MKTTNNMNGNFDFSQVGKRMPYSVPNGFLDEVESDVLKRVHAGRATVAVRSSRRPELRRLWVAVLSSAAVVAVLFVVAARFLLPTPSGDMQSVEQAFSNLSPADQSYLLEVYQEDVFIDE